ncbi:hypothetical protein L9F63_016024 [Diploptera punctata]|uniref:Copper homeostasis protein cutC homolog n=1 Tax=Diploptera punctata TaxID=6984 RepID=A0AAD8A2R7_DIPPU|nr:hypothetical protein L9F63_016024 [Diploptera punctata]
MEVCVDSVESALNAYHGGASRLELCAALSEGGLTPTPGLLRIVKSIVTIPVFVMLRLRAGGDFVYTQQEIEVMKNDATVLKDWGADGFVFGALTPSGSVDEKACREIMNIVSPMPITFHRAFDVCIDVHEALPVIIKLGFSRILTSGQELSAEKGISLIKKLISSANGQIIIMPGAGITKDNVGEILRQTGAVEFHASAKISKVNNDSSNKCTKDFSREEMMYVTSVDLVKEMVKVANELWSSRKWEINV